MIESFFVFIENITNPDKLSVLIDTVLSGWWIYAAMSFIVYAENAILLGLVLPGDSVLFTLGVVAATGKLNFYLTTVLLFFSAILGDSTGYYLGKRTGPKIFSRPDSILFKQEYVRRTQAFFEKYGGKTIMFARFVPVVRSFAPFMAGVGRMPYNTFLKFSFTGSFLWVFGLTTLGFTLGNVPIIKNNFEKAIFIVIAISFTPAIIELLLQKRNNKKTP